MATMPYIVLGPTCLASLVGLVRGPDKTIPSPAEDWRQATVDVVIPALNEERNIALCIASVMRQTLRPRNIIVVDDGSRDRTSEVASSFSEANGVDLIYIRRKKPIGKTPTIKRQAREFNADVEFILDGDTILQSADYIERTVQELYQGVGIASACGVILPLRERDRKSMLQSETVQRFLTAMPSAPLMQVDSLFSRIRRGATNIYRGALYMFLERFIYHGQMVLCGTITNPVGCAVAYRRKYIESLFEKYEPILGDDLTNSEDIFIGFSLINEGYRNIQVPDIYARSEEPEASRLPRQLYLWSSSFLQCCYYFDSLLKSPLKAVRRMLKHSRDPKPQEFTQERRRIREAYRQPFGEEFTRTYGRPAGWVLFISAVEKIAFPTVLILMLIFQLWTALKYTVILESALTVCILAAIAKDHRLEYAAKGFLATPVRYFSALWDFATIMRFVADLWIFQDRSWRK
jgi:glycosyltransferase involved in cell wall biosynthesis